MSIVYKPCKYYKSFYDVNLYKLKEEGIKVIASDLDNTIVAHNDPHSSRIVKEQLDKIKMLGFEFVIISNNNKGRVEKFCRDLDVKHYSNAMKPLKKTFKKMLIDLDCTNEEIVLIGDQVLTDIIGSNRMNIQSILVEPICVKDSFNTKFNRLIEKRLLKKLEKKKLFKKGEYSE